ncbi:hypothetical protein B0H19DRAFT_1072691 [Mycena capillaripes]|nr:hypothetical protein B0H19DRAFT_1072691 [Mycena capillaripes]
MPPRPSVTQIRLNNITKCLNAAANTLEVIAGSIETPFLKAISTTTQSLLRFAENIKQNKDDCVQLMEQTHQLLNAIILVHIKSDTAGELSPKTLHMIHTYIEAQQNQSKLKKFFRQTEMNALLRDCTARLQEGLDVFEVYFITLRKSNNSLKDGLGGSQYYDRRPRDATIHRGETPGNP